MSCCSPDERTIKLVVPIGEVPEGCIVTKKTGEKPYRVMNAITLYDEKRVRQTINANPGCRYMVSADDGFSINAVPDTLEVMWCVSPEGLYEYALSLIEGTPQ